MASENRPGVIITQALTETNAVSIVPTLIPVVLAPCYQIIKAVSADGTLNSEALHPTKYNQAPLVISQGEFPDPRGNIDEIDVLEDYVHVQMLKSAKLEKLQRGSNGTTGSSFLARFEHIYRPAIEFDLTSSPLIFSQDTNLVVAIDGVNYTFVFTTSTTTAADVVAVINGSFGSVVSFVSENDTAVLFSPTYGPAGTLIVRGGSAAIGTLSSTLSTTFDSKVSGAGLYAFDDEDGDTLSPYISYNNGIAATGVAGSNVFSPISWPTWAGFNKGVNASHTFSNSKPAAVTFGNSGIPVKPATRTTPGDYLVVNGVRPKSAEVIAVDATRVKLGTINTASSTYSASTGELVTRIYDTLEFDTLSSTTPFSPRFAYFMAQNLVYGAVSPVGTQATVSGTASNVLPARKAQISGEFDSSFSAGPVGMSGFTFVIQEIIDGIQQEEVITTFVGTLSKAQVAAAITANTSLACSADVVGDFLVISSSKVGADQSVTVKSTGTANALLGFSSVQSTSASGKDLEVAQVASIIGGNFDIAALTNSPYTLAFAITDSLGERTGISQSVDTSTVTNYDELVAAIATAFGGSSSDLTLYHEGIAFATVSTDDGTNITAGNIVFSSIEGGSGVMLTLENSVADMTLGAVDMDGADLLKDATLTFYLDDNPFAYEVIFESNSVLAAKDLINDSVGGDVEIASVAADGTVTLSSAFYGYASKIDVTDAGAATSSVLGFTSGADVSANGSGRPDPDFYLDPVTNSIVLGANQLRNLSTGIPYAKDSAFASFYIEYKALRHDVSASAADPALLTFSTMTELEASIGPVSVENPLGLAAYICMLNSAGVSISCLGIDETSDSAPTGTVDAYLRALSFLESKEVYTIAPMTDDAVIQQIVATHVAHLSTPQERGERIAMLWKPTPTRAADTSIEGASGAAAQTGTANQLVLDSNPSSELIDNGIIDLTSIAADSGVYLEITTVAVGKTTVSNYSVQSVSGTVVQMRTTFSSSENADGFYSETPFSGSASFDSIAYVLRIRGKKLVITGTTLPDTSKILAAAAEQAVAFSHRRVFLLMGDSADTSIDGVVTNVPGYYIAAGIAGMVGSQAPQQPFTNVVMNGFTRVYGTDDTFSENQLDIPADSGRYILKNLGGGIASRHQRSTAITSIESQELSITKAIDFLAKGLRQVNRVFIGKYVITPGFLDQLSLANHGHLDLVVQYGVVNSAKLKSLLQSETAPDTVLIEVEVQPAYPCNKIRITIVS